MVMSMTQAYMATNARCALSQAHKHPTMDTPISPTLNQASTHSQASIHSNKHLTLAGKQVFSLVPSKALPERRR